MVNECLRDGASCLPADVERLARGFRPGGESNAYDKSKWDDNVDVIRNNTEDYQAKMKTRK
jgi:hypothetical protein